MFIGHFARGHRRPLSRVATNDSFGSGGTAEKSLSGNSFGSLHGWVSVVECNEL